MPASIAEIPGAPKALRPRRNKWGCGIFLLPVVFAVLYLVVHAKDWHPSDHDFPLQGIDVSHHQGAIAWPELPAQGVDFAYIKATEGGDFVDSSFSQNWAGASHAGIRRGAYHFFTLCRPGAEQADNFIATVPKESNALPPAVDLEYLGNCPARPSPAQVRAELGAFLTKVEAFYGQRAILYMTREFDDAYAIDAYFGRPLWLRSLVMEPRFGSRPWALWQVSNFRILHGVAGRVDWNVMRPASRQP